MRRTAGVFALAAIFGAVAMLPASADDKSTEIKGGIEGKVAKVGYRGEPVSLTMPTSQPVWDFPHFPAPFEGLLPEGVQLDALLRIRKLDKSDLFGQLLEVGQDVVGSLRIEATT